MRMPSLLPEELASYVTASSEEQLLKMLIQNPKDFIAFFTYACDHETWCKDFPVFTSQALAWMTLHFFSGELSLGLIRPAIEAIQYHFENIKEWLPIDIVCKLKECDVAINSLLFQAISPVFRQLIQSECFYKGSKTLVLDRLSLREFKALEEYVYTSEVNGLWHKSEDELMEIAKMAIDYELPNLLDSCQEILIRFVLPANVFFYLITAHELSLRILTDHCCRLVNSLQTGVQLSSDSPGLLTAELLEITENSLEYFQPIMKIVTDFVCGPAIGDDPVLEKLLPQCPKLISLDLGKTQHFNDRILKALPRLKELVLAGAVWLDDEAFAKIAGICPYLIGLNLTNCIQISFVGWGELLKFRQLQILNLSSCLQLVDEEFLIVMKSCHGLTRLNLSECRQLSEISFFELANTAEQLSFLNLSRTNITDASLIQVTSRLRSLAGLEIVRCQLLSEQGIVEAISHSSTLKEVNLLHCNISFSAIEELQRSSPQTRLVGIS